MPEPPQRLARPLSEAEISGVASPRGVNRNHLTLYLSMAAILLSVASAGVNLFVFIAAGQRKTVNEADQIQLQASANRVLQELNTDPKSHPQLAEELNRLYKSLNYRPAFDSKLNVYERTAFGMVVQNYAVPVAEVQLQTTDARVKVMEQGYKVGTHYLNYDELGCVIDPFGYGCEGRPWVGVNQGGQPSK